MDLELGGMAASDGFLQPDRKLQDLNAASAFNTMSIVSASQGKSSEKCLIPRSTGNRFPSYRITQALIIEPDSASLLFRLSEILLHLRQKALPVRAG